MALSHLHFFQLSLDGAVHLRDITDAERLRWLDSHYMRTSSERQLSQGTYFNAENQRFRLFNVVTSAYSR